MSVTYRLKESSKPYQVSFDGGRISGADLRERIAEQLKCQSHELLLRLDDAEVRDDAQVPTMSLLVVERLSGRDRPDRLRRGGGPGGIGMRGADAPATFGSAGGRAAGGLGPRGRGHPGLAIGASGGGGGGGDEAQKLLEMQMHIAEVSGTAADQSALMGPRRGGRGGRGGMGGATRPFVPGEMRVPPADYVCDNCGLRGHFIMDCHLPRDSAARERVLPLPIGIAESQLIVVTSVEEAQYRTRDGKLVKRKINDVALVGSSSGASGGGATAAAAAAAEGGGAGGDALSASESAPSELLCGKCRRLVVGPVRTPCCDRLICGARCLDRYIDEHDSACPLCGDWPIITDDVEPDTETQKKVDALLEQQRQEKRT